jgi:transketolase
MLNLIDYPNIRKKLVSKIIDLAYLSKEGHIPSSLSILDILYYLYSEIINSDNKFFLSKGHAAIGLYVILNEFGFISDDILYTFCKYDSLLGGHPTSKIPGVEASTGSLGHGMPIAAGVAISQKIKQQSGKVFCLIGDGESNEGTIWETALLASQHKLNNFFCILDHNHSTDRALVMDSYIDKFDSFGWNTYSMNGHDMYDITYIFKNILKEENNQKPTFILANTIKGYGIPIMENNPEWHHKIPNEINHKEIIKEILK